jgi:G3E family GTPase
MIEFGSRSATPVTILTGFLGAGKTTLLNRILNGEHGLRVAVLVNDFGSINVDANLVVGVEDEVMSLVNGCVCCSIRDDLIETIDALLARPEAPEYILLEASGVADPSGIALTFTDMKFRDRIRLDSIMCLVDAEQVFEAPEQMELKLRQMAFSDMIILNKVDLVGENQVQKVRDWLSSRFRRYRMIESVKANVPLEILLGVGRFDASQLTDHHDHGPTCGCEDHAHVHEGGHATTFGTIALETDAAICLSSLRQAVKKLPGSVYRVKGIVRSVEDPEHRVVLQVVGKRVDIAREGLWGNRTPKTQIIAIGVPDAVDANTLADVFICG